MKDVIIWVVLDRLSKVAYFILLRFMNSASDLAHIYLIVIERVHGVLETIVSNSDARFVFKFQESLQGTQGTNLKLSTAFHSQIDGHSELTIQNLGRHA